MRRSRYDLAKFQILTFPYPTCIRSARIMFGNKSVSLKVLNVGFLCCRAWLQREVGGEDDRLATASDMVGVYKTRGYNTPALHLQGRLDATVNGASQRANFNTRKAAIEIDGKQEGCFLTLETALGEQRTLNS